MHPILWTTTLFLPTHRADSFYIFCKKNAQNLYHFNLLQIHLTQILYDCISLSPYILNTPKRMSFSTGAFWLALNAKPGTPLGEMRLKTASPLRAALYC